jgi:hypothetical protein
MYGIMFKNYILYPIQVWLVGEILVMNDRKHLLTMQLFSEPIL